MTNIKLSSNNVFDERYQKFVNSKRALKLEQKFKDKTFNEKTKKLVIVAMVLSIICTSFSAISEHFWLHHTFAPMMPIPVMTWVSVIFIIALVEYGKREAVPEIWKSWFQYKKVDGINLVVALVLMSLSIFASFEGAKILPKVVSNPPILVSIDSINQAYTGQIALIDASISKQESTTWKGKITRQAQSNISQLNQQKQSLITQRNEATKQASSANNETIKSYEADLEQQGLNIGYVTLICEVLLFLCGGFIEYRDYRAIAEFADIEEHESSEVNVTNIKSETITSNDVKNGKEAPSHDTSSFFFRNGKKENKNVARNGKNGKNTAYGKGRAVYTGICKNCNSEFDKRNPRKLYCNADCKNEYNRNRLRKGNK